MAGLPESWRHYEWKLAAALLVFLWLLDDWTSGASLPGLTSLHHMATSLWGLLSHAF